MDVLEFREYCLSLPLAEECTPFDETTLVYKIGGKMFAYADMVTFDRGISMKCDPSRAEELRERFRDVVPGFHSNKRHWNTVHPNSDIPDKLIREWIRDSYNLVIRGLPKGRREELLAQLNGK